MKYCTLSGCTLVFVSLGTSELLIVLVIALLVFGTRLPKIARSMGQAKVEFKRGQDEAEAGEHKTDDGPSSAGPIN